MQQLSGKTAFVTGGASGIGFALSKTFAEAGMKVMLADIEADALASALKSLSTFGSNVRVVVCDVVDPDSVERAAQETFAAFGNVHVVCNNAGVAAGGGIENISLENWRWVLDVNVMGVVHGIRSFLPHIRAHGEGGHIVNTASMAGLQSEGGLSSYGASKYAVMSISEGLHKDLAPLGIGVSVLCPSFTKTKIADSGRNRQPQYGSTPLLDPNSKAGEQSERIRNLLDAGREPSEIAAHVLAAIRANELYILTHPEWFWEVEKRFAAIRVAADIVAATK
jgi:NAD(P)-dependent dehydrogenase (short-subunit alcohol dehydrogenase family)